ncbi:MAG: hypothetical protein HND57_15935 [Planctomycetes bacterium]|nr:hypothetical protein [Planctomycetota bacterium]
MNTLTGMALATALFLPACTSDPTSDSTQEGTAVADNADDDARMDWWRDARFGLFIHWGLYAIPAGEWGNDTHHGEWIMNTAHIPVEQYEQFVPQFNPVNFDADEWVRMAKDAGMKYIVITSKHHDGFALFDSAVSDYDVMATPFQRDILKELAEACERQGMTFCFYHSIMDWHHPDYIPRRGWEDRSADGADFNRYVTYLRSQVSELLTNYGPIGVMWFDGEWENTWTHEYGQPLYDLCLQLQPDVIVNDRVDKGRQGHSGIVADEAAGDFGTPEQHIPPTGLPGVDWETCMTMNGNWGYNKNDNNWKSTKDLVRKLVDIASKNGNFLLNVGPKADGTFPQPSIDRLREVGQWMHVYGDAIYGTAASPFETLPFNGRCTAKYNEKTGDTTLYLHVFSWPINGIVKLEGLGSRVKSARLMNDPDTDLPVTKTDGTLEIHGPNVTPNQLCSVVALEIDGQPIIYQAPKIVAGSDFLVDTLTVSIDAGSDSLQVRYTLDDSEPTRKSPVYNGPFTIDQSMMVRARTFHKGKPVTGVTRRQFTQVQALQAALVDAQQLTPGLLCSVYKGDWNSLPNFESLEPVEQATTPIITLPPGPAIEYEARRFEGFIHVEADDVYQFALNSDDGSRLIIDGRIVVNNDGLHGPAVKYDVIGLAAGWHEVAVEFFNKGGGAVLSLHMGRVGESDPKPVTEKQLAMLKSH